MKTTDIASSVRIYEFGDKLPRLQKLLFCAVDRDDQLDFCLSSKILRISEVIFRRSLLRPMLWEIATSRAVAALGKNQSH